jgi:hypothetical protein
MQQKIPPTYSNEPNILGVEPSMTESIFSALRQLYPYLYDLILNEGVTVNLPTREKIMDIYETSDKRWPVPIYPEPDSPALGLFHPRSGSVVYTPHPEWKQTLLHELGHAGIHYSPEWGTTTARMPLTEQQDRQLGWMGYPTPAGLTLLLMTDPEAYTSAINQMRTDPHLRRVGQEETLVRYLFPTSNEPELGLTNEQRYIADRLLEYLKYGPQEK